MKHKTFLISAFCFLVICFSASSQDKPKSISKKAKKVYEEGKEHLNWDRFPQAEERLLEAIRIEPEYPEALQGLGFLYVNTRRYQEAYDVLKKLTETKGAFSNEIYLELAKMCLAVRKPEAGAENINLYLAKAKPSPEKLNEIEQLKRNLSFMQQHINDKRYGLEFQLVPAGAGVNTEAREYFPTITADGNRMYFSRKVKSGKLDHEDIFYSEWNGKEWGEALSIGPNINTPANEAAPAISPDGRTLYFTICESEFGLGGCDIWFSRKVGDEWMKPENIGKPINSTAKETQPCISSDGRSLYFVSGRKGGFGQLDIWVSQKDKKGVWSEPINLGPKINTTLDEQRPFIHPDNQTLYFTSDGHSGFGKQDIFLSRKKEKGNWDLVENLGPQINSYENEEGLYVTLDNAKGYLATDRVLKSDPYARDYDIYYFVLPPNLAPQQVTYVKGKVSSADSKKFIAAQINFIDLKTGEFINQSQSDEKNGEFLLCLPVGKDYAMNINKENYLFYSQNFSLKKIPPGKTYYLEAQLQSIKADQIVALRNVFFETNSVKLDTVSKIELNILVEFLNENPTVKIEVGGHTDNTGNAAYNLDLSKNRAKTVYDYLIAQSVDKKRLTYKGYGQATPLTSNASEEGRALNRRTEFKVIGN